MAKTTKETSRSTKLLAFILIPAAIFWAVTESGGYRSSSGAEPAPEFGSNDALAMCRSAILRIAKDPEKAKVPYVPGQPFSNGFKHTWGPSTKMMRLRNGLGLEVAASGSCFVDKAAKRVTELTLDGERII